MHGSGVPGPRGRKPPRSARQPQRQKRSDAERAVLRALHDAAQAVSKHLAILEEANLVATVKRGREKLHYLNPVPIAQIANRWIRKFERTRVDALVDLKKRLESE